MKPRVLVVSNAYPSSEKPYAGVFVEAQVTRLRSLGLDVDVHAMPRVFTHRLGSVQKYFSSFVRFIPRLSSRYDAVHVHFLSPLLAVGWLYRILRPKSRLILTVHGTGVRALERRRWLRQLYAMLIRRVDFVQAVGGGLADDFQRLLDRRVDLIQPAGVDREVFRPLPGQTKDFDFVFVGSLTMTKGFDLFLGALEEVRTSPSICVIGTGEFEAMVERDPRVTYLRSLPPEEVARQINRSRFLVLPTRMDAFGLVVAEAMHCGVPVIASPVDGMLEQVIDGENGFFLQSMTSAELARVLDHALALDPAAYDRLREGALAVNPSYSLEAVCGRLVEIYGAVG